MATNFEPVAINYVGVKELMDIPGIGKATATNLVKHKLSRGNLTVESFKLVLNQTRIIPSEQILSFFDFTRNPTLDRDTQTDSAVPEIRSQDSDALDTSVFLEFQKTMERAGQLRQQYETVVRRRDRDRLSSLDLPSVPQNRVRPGRLSDPGPSLELPSVPHNRGRPGRPSDPGPRDPRDPPPRLVPRPILVARSTTPSPSSANMATRDIKREPDDTQLGPVSRTPRIPDPIALTLLSKGSRAAGASTPRHIDSPRKPHVNFQDLQTPEREWLMEQSSRQDNKYQGRVERGNDKTSGDFQEPRRRESTQDKHARDSHSVRHSNRQKSDTDDDTEYEKYYGNSRPSNRVQSNYNAGSGESDSDDSESEYRHRDSERHRSHSSRSSMSSGRRRETRRPKRRPQSPVNDSPSQSSSGEESAYHRYPAPRSTYRRSDPARRDYYAQQVSDEEGTRHEYPSARRTYGRSDPIRSLPRNCSYNGKGSWRAFKHKFLRFTTIYKLTNEEATDALCMCLTDAASEYFAILLDEREYWSFNKLMTRLESRFGTGEVQETAMVMFQQAVQEGDESLNDWGDRVRTLATPAFKGLTESYARKQTVIRFIQGLQDNETAKTVGMNVPSTMDEALNKVRWCQYMSQSIGTSTSSVKTARKKAEEQRITIAAVQDSHTALPQHPSEERLLTLEKSMESITSQLSKLSANLGRVIKFQGEVKPSFSPQQETASGERATPKNTKCFRCGQLGHWRSECQAPTHQLPKNQGLNGQGSSSQVNARSAGKK